MSDPSPPFGAKMTAGNRSHRSYRDDPPSAIGQRDDKENLNPPAAWADLGDLFMPVPKTTRALEAGFYTPVETQRGRALRRMQVRTDNLVELPDPVIDTLLTEFVTFWKRAPAFGGMGLSPKRGLLLWGPPGSGKTSAVQRMAEHMIRELGGICVMAGHPGLTADTLHDLRMIEPHRPLVVVFEDLDAMVDRWGEPELLALLDGETQIGNVVNVATTNYPELLDPRFVNRPGRFGRTQYVGMPNQEAREVYIKARVPGIDDVRLARWVKESDGWSIAHLRELVVATEMLGDPDDATIERLAGMHQKPDSQHSPELSAVGFGT